jgi:acyl carrier protein
MIEAVVFVEDLAGRTIPEQAIASWRTVADLHSPLA